jgi:hypothetical protein
MKKLVLLTLTFLVGYSTSVFSQKHAPRPAKQRVKIHGIYPEGSQRMLGLSDVRGLNSWDLKVMRNEIFARHGYIFKSEEMVNYFSSQRWYQPIYDDVTPFLSEIEKKNIDFIKSIE